MKGYVRGSFWHTTTIESHHSTPKRGPIGTYPPSGHSPRSATSANSICVTTNAQRWTSTMPSYARVWCTGSGGGLVPGSSPGLAVAEAHTLDHLTEALGAVQPAPARLGRLGEPEHPCGRPMVAKWMDQRSRGIEVERRRCGYPLAAARRRLAGRSSSRFLSQAMAHGASTHRVPRSSSITSVRWLRGSLFRLQLDPMHDVGRSGQSRSYGRPTARFCDDAAAAGQHGWAQACQAPSHQACSGHMCSTIIA